MAPGLRWPDALWSGEISRIGGDIVLNNRVEFVIAKPVLFNGRSKDDIGMVAFMGPTFCINPSDCLPRTLHVVVDIATIWKRITETQITYQNKIDKLQTFSEQYCFVLHWFTSLITKSISIRLSRAHIRWCFVNEFL